jgi:hypothetical protein
VTLRDWKLLLRELHLGVGGGLHGHSHHSSNENKVYTLNPGKFIGFGVYHTLCDMAYKFIVMKFRDCGKKLIKISSLQREVDKVYRV